MKAEVPMATTTGWSRSVPCVAVAKIGALDYCTSSFLGDGSEMEKVKGRAQRWHPLASVLGEYLCSYLNVCQTRSLPFRLKIQYKQIGLFNRKTGVCFSQLCALCPWGHHYPRIISPFVTVLWNPGMQALLVNRVRQSRGVHWVAATKQGVSNIKSRIPDMCKGFPRGDTGVLKYGRRRAQR